MAKIDGFGVLQFSQIMNRGESYPGMSEFFHICIDDDWNRTKQKKEPGIFEPEDAKALLDAGASLVQIYTGMVYRGPGLVKMILKELA